MTSNAQSNPSVGVPFYDLDYMPDDLVVRAQSELFEDEDTRLRSLEQLRSMLREEKDLLWQDDDLFLLAFLRARKFDVHRAYQLVKNTYTVMGKYEHMYYNYRLEDLKKAFEENSCSFLPYRDREGSVIILFRLETWNPAVNNLADHILCTTLGLHCAIRSAATQVAGFKFLIDYKGMTFKQLLHCSFSNLRLIVELLQNCFPARFRGIHVLNQNDFFTVIWRISEPLMSKKLRERFHIHGDNMESLHKHFHPSILPAELGGHLPPVSSAAWGKWIMDSEDYLNHVFSFGYEKHLKKAWKKNGYR